MNQDHVQDYLLRNGCEWIPFKLNVPHSSHMGGTWERMIRSVRNALEPLLLQAGSQLDDETLRTLLTEVECIINSRPLSVDNLCDAEAPEPLTPNHLLTMKPKRVLRTAPRKVSKSRSVLSQTLEKSSDGGESIFKCYKSGKSASSLRETLLLVI